MRVLVVGNGGREHALVWKLSQSKRVSALFAAPGNPGTSSLAENVSISITEIDRLVDFSAREQIDLVIVGPEQPLELGLVDALEIAGINVFGPCKAAARLESSKSFAKDVLQAAGVPTASYQQFNDQNSASIYLNSQSCPIVVKADGLAAGKGVYVCLTKAEAETAIAELYATDPKRKVVIEQFLQGKEASFIVACNADRIVPLATAHDYKRIFDDDLGPNTGGMGTVSPTPNLSNDQERWVLEQVIRPVLAEIQKRGTHYKGFLYAGLMISPAGEINVLEFNCRLGDPETQVILPRLKADLFEILYSLSCGSELPNNISWSDEACVCVVVASKDYPQSSSKGAIIKGIEALNDDDSTWLFQAGTSISPAGDLLTCGGRVLNVVARGTDVEAARGLAYKAIQNISFAGMQYRKDIGRK